eukprot:6470209-Amphidinium_carterae.1
MASFRERPWSLVHLLSPFPSGGSSCIVEVLDLARWSLKFADVDRTAKTSSCLLRPQNDQCHCPRAIEEGEPQELTEPAAWPGKKGDESAVPRCMADMLVNRHVNKGAWNNLPVSALHVLLSQWQQGLIEFLGCRVVRCYSIADVADRMGCISLLSVPNAKLISARADDKGNKAVRMFDGKTRGSAMIQDCESLVDACHAACVAFAEAHGGAFSARWVR